MTPETALAAAAKLAERLAPGDLDSTLGQITAAAVELIPDAAFSSITVRHGDRLVTVNATDDSVLAIDAMQYGLQEGPCYEAATDVAQVTAPDLAADSRFPRYGPKAVEAGIRAQAAFRLFERSGGVQGALNLYATKPGAFTDLEDTAALFRSQAALAIDNARVYADATRRADRLRELAEVERLVRDGAVAWP